MCSICGDPGRAGKGCGTRAMAALRGQYTGYRLFLAAEALDPAADNYAARVRRKKFYLRCGLQDLHARVREGDVIYELLGAGGAVSGAEYSRFGAALGRSGARPHGHDENASINGVDRRMHMNLCDIDTIRAVLTRHGFRFSRSLARIF